MKDYKFRVWEKSTNSFHWPKQGVFDLIFRNLPLKPESNITIQQYTGIRDKNHKEIYEGDILRNPSALTLSGEVVFDGGAFCLQEFNGEGRMTTKYVPLRDYLQFEDTYDSRFEIIGNIFENPELITR